MKNAKMYLVIGVIILLLVFGGSIVKNLFQGQGTETKTEDLTGSKTEGQLIDQKRELQKVKQEMIDGLNLEQTKRYLQGDESFLEGINDKIKAVDELIQVKKKEQGLDYMEVGFIFGQKVEAGYIEPATEKETVKTEKKQLVYNAIEKPQQKSNGKVKHLGFGDNDVAQMYVQYAYDISNGDMGFLGTMDCENGQWDRLRQSEVVMNGVRETSYGLCQIYDKAHPDIIANPEFWSNRKFQVEQCYNLYKGGTKFYGKTRIVKGMKCVDYVQSRFQITK